MDEIVAISSSYEETMALGAAFARQLGRGDIVCLFGELGAGKTAFVKGLAKGLKIDPAEVHSPTFTLMNIYKGKLSLYHFDLYRIRSVDLYGIGYEEFFYGQGITAVEWSEKLEELTPERYWDVHLRHVDETRREIRVSLGGKASRRAPEPAGASR